MSQPRAVVCVTGVGGFVGGYLAPALQAAGAHVCGTAYDEAEANRVRARGVADVMVANLLDPPALQEALAPATHVVHLAAISSGAAGSEAWQANVEGTRNVLRAAAGKRVLLASTGYVYGPVSPDAPATEDSPLNPMGGYAASKAEMERVARAEFPNADIVTARSFNHTGPGQGDGFVVPAFARQIAQIEAGARPPVLSVGNLDALREMMDVRDVVRAYVAMLFLPREAGSVFNVANASPVAVRFLLDGLLALAKVPITVEADPARLRPSDVACTTGSAARLFSATGWRPEIPLSQTLEDTLNWWRATDC